MASITNFLLITLFVLHLVTLATSTFVSLDSPRHKTNEPKHDLLLRSSIGGRKGVSRGHLRANGGKSKHPLWLKPSVRSQTVGAAPAPAPVPARKYGKRSLNPRKVRDRFCMPKKGASNEALQKNIDYICKRAIDCKPIQPGGDCFNADNSLYYRAAYLMHMYYNINGRVATACDFFQTGNITNVNPTKGNCIFK